MELPQHAFEVKISIGGETWDYVRRRLVELATEVERRDADHFQMYGGGAGGSYSVTTTTRDISPEAYREELERWRQSLPKEALLESDLAPASE